MTRARDGELMTLYGAFFTARQSHRGVAALVREVFSERGKSVEDARVIVREPDDAVVLLDNRWRDEYREFWRALVRALDGPSTAAPPPFVTHEVDASACVDPVGLGLDAATLLHISSMLQPEGTAVLLLARARALAEVRRMLAHYSDGYVLRRQLRGFLMAPIETARERRRARWMFELPSARHALVTGRTSGAFVCARALSAACEPRFASARECRS